MNKEKLMNILIFILAIALVIVLIYGFKIIKEKDSICELEQFKNISLINFDGDRYNAGGLFKEDNYFLIFNITDCPSCIEKGVEDLKYFQKEGKNCFGLIVYDRPKEIRGGG